MNSSRSRGTADWEKAILALLIAILVLGVFTIWQVSIFAPTFLLEGAVGVYILLIILTLITWRRFPWIYLVDGLLALGLVAASVAQPEHFTFATSGAIFPAFIVIVGDVLAFFLGIMSLFVFWNFYSPRIQARQLEHLKVHANCSPDAPCKTDPNYRV